MKIYFAAKFEDAPLVKRLMGDLASHGIYGTMRWVDQTDSYGERPEYHSGIDEEDIRAADALVILARRWSPGSDSSGGRHWEMGFAYGLGKPIVAVGTFGSTNPFFFRPGVKRLETIELFYPDDQFIRRLAERIAEALQPTT